MIPVSEPSLKSVFIMLKAGGRVIGTGTAFVIRKNATQCFLITARHNVTGRHHQTDEPLSPTCAIPDELEYVHRIEWPRGLEMSKSIKLLDGDRPLWKEHPYLKARADIVAVEMPDLRNAQIDPYRTSIELDADREDFLVGPGEPISVVGFPFGLRPGHTAVWATGFVATEIGIDYEELPSFLIDCRSRRGQSGSPVIAYRPAGSIVRLKNYRDYMVTQTSRTKLLGLYSGRVNAESDLGYVWKTAALQEMIEAA